MPHRPTHYALNDDLLALLPMLDSAFQQEILHQWASMSIHDRKKILHHLRFDLNGEDEPSFATLSKLAAFFDCSVIDMVRYIRTDDPQS